jgi:hypothetical protein
VKQLFRLKIGPRLQTEIIRQTELSPIDGATFNLWTKFVMVMISDATATVKTVCQKFVHRRGRTLSLEYEAVVFKCTSGVYKKIYGIIFVCVTLI